MAIIKVIQLTDQQRLQLEDGFRNGKSHAYRMRCRAILLKSQGLKSTEVGVQTEMTHISVNSWVKRFEREGVKGLETKPGRGRKPIMDCSDEESVRQAIEQDRQSVKKAKEAWQQASGKEASESTFRAFLSALARDIDV
jgi:transposase